MGNTFGHRRGQRNGKERQQAVSETAMEEGRRRTGLDDETDALFGIGVKLRTEHFAGVEPLRHGKKHVLGNENSR